jgi:DNA polymerase-3 subunit delta'
VAGKSINWKYLVAQDRVKEILSSAFLSGNLAHAYLLCGDEGVGKFAAALDMAMALLCTTEGNVPCGICSSCKRILNFNHPDLHIVLPIPLKPGFQTDDGLTERGWKYIADKIQAKIANPYLPLTFELEESDSGEKDDDKIAKTDRYKVPIIPIDLLREVDHAILRGSVEGKSNITIFYDIDVMVEKSQNAMLKTLEEPPANTYLFLTTCKPELILPTIYSRCQIVRFGHVPPNQVQKELMGSLGSEIDSEKIKDAVYYSMGSLGRALTLIKTETTIKGSKTLEETSDEVKDFWNVCCSGNWQEIGPAVDVLVRDKNLAVHDQFFSYMLYLIRNSFLQKMGSSENYIDADNILPDPCGLLNDPGATARLTYACNEALISVRKYGNLGIIYVNFVMTLMEILHVEKQQAC